MRLEDLDRQDRTNSLGRQRIIHEKAVHSSLLSRIREDVSVYMYVSILVRYQKFQSIHWWIISICNAEIGARLFIILKTLKPPRQNPKEKASQCGTRPVHDRLPKSGGNQASGKPNLSHSYLMYIRMGYNFRVNQSLSASIFHGHVPAIGHVMMSHYLTSRAPLSHLGAISRRDGG